MTTRGDNVNPVLEGFLTDRDVEVAAFDRLPKQMRLALSSALYEYSAVQMWQVFEEVKRQMKSMDVTFMFRDPLANEVWAQIIPMIAMNDRDQKDAERQMNQNLVIQFAEEKRERIERAFKQAS